VADVEQDVGPAGYPTPRERRPEDRVAVIGSGPAGLSAAYFLTLDGHAVTIYEAAEHPGGMLASGVPGYRLPPDILKREIDGILGLGVELRTGVRLGRDMSLSDLRDDGYRAIFLAPGMPVGRRLGIEGEELDGVVQAIALLSEAKEGRPRVGRHPVVIGGGNVAMDAARTLVRLGAERVTVACLEQPEEMPAAPEEVSEALEEGIVFEHGVGPRGFLADGDRVGSVELRRCVACFDEQGRFAPRYDDADVRSLPADQVVVAVGQQQAPALLEQVGQDASGGRLQVDSVTLQTSVPDLFAGGDAVTGPRTVIEAVAAGKRAAASMAAWLRGERLDPQWPGLADRAPEQELKAPRALRHQEPHRPAKQRVETGAEVAIALDEASARDEAGRCLACGGCSECYQCVEACQAQAIQHFERDREEVVHAGAVVLAPGLDQINPSARGEFGHGRYPDVISSLELERLLSSSGPGAGHFYRPSDGTRPKRMAWIQCVGSRDERGGRRMCSAVCCMFATKQAALTCEHYPDTEATIFFLDMRAYGKGFDVYVERAKSRHGVRYQRAMVSRVDEVPGTGELEIAYRDNDGRLQRERFDMVVLSSGLTASASARELAGCAGIELDEYGFATRRRMEPNLTDRPGVFVAGGIEGPRDIPETVVSASSAAARCGAVLQRVRGTQVTPRQFPPERDVRGDPLRVGVFVCRCGVNIARVVDVPALTEYASKLPGVVHAEENLYTCSADTQRRMVEQIKEHDLNRVVVASCTPRTHEALFQATVRVAGLNKYLFEMANIRDQCSWVHADQEQSANEKAEDLVRMAVARALELEPLPERRVDVVGSALVVGGGVAGLAAAAALAEQGFPTTVVEREAELGGNLRRLRRLQFDQDPRVVLRDLLERIEHTGKVTLLTQAELVRTKGHVGHFRSTIRTPDGQKTVEHGVTIVASGARAQEPNGAYMQGQDPRVMTQVDLEQRLDQADQPFPQRVVMIQCVGSREGSNPVCSRVCCTQAVRNALWLKERNPDTDVTILFRDIRTYGDRELLYRRARREGVRFVRFEPEHPPQVEPGDGHLQVRVWDYGLSRDLLLAADALVLSTGIAPSPTAKDLSAQLKVPLGGDGFFQEAHMKLRPLDFASEGLFLCGLAHGPKAAEESIAQATGAAGRAATLLSQKKLEVSGEVSVVDPERCIGCLTCVRSCPYHVPEVGEDKVAHIEAVSCQGCGICAAACPRQAITTWHSTPDQLVAKVEALFAEASGSW